jgi:hypothetical protein
LPLPRFLSLSEFLGDVEVAHFNMRLSFVRRIKRSVTVHAAEAVFGAIRYPVSKDMELILARKDESGFANCRDATTQPSNDSFFSTPFLELARYH